MARARIHRITDDRQGAPAAIWAVAARRHRQHFCHDHGHDLRFSDSLVSTWAQRHMHIFSPDRGFQGSRAPASVRVRYMRTRARPVRIILL